MYEIRHMSLMFPINAFIVLLMLHIIGSESVESSAGINDEAKALCDIDSATSLNFCENVVTHTHANHRKIGILEKPFSPTKKIDSLFFPALFNTTMNFIVPGVKVNLPHNNEEGSLLHLAMQAFFGLFWAVAWISTIAVPAALTYFQPLGIEKGRSFEDPNSFHLKWKLTDKQVDDIGLNWTSCLQKAICQAHESPTRKYGVLGKITRILFPVYSDKSILPSSVPLLHEAAKNGIIGHNCSHTYKCFFDVLDVILYLKKYCFSAFPP